MARKGTLEELLELSLVVARHSADPAEAFAWIARLRGRPEVGMGLGEAVQVSHSPDKRTRRGGRRSPSSTIRRWSSRRSWPRRGMRGWSE